MCAQFCRRDARPRTWRDDILDTRRLHETRDGVFSEFIWAFARENEQSVASFARPASGCCSPCWVFIVGIGIGSAVLRKWATNDNSFYGRKRQVRRGQTPPSIYQNSEPDLARETTSKQRGDSRMKPWFVCECVSVVSSDCLESPSHLNS